MSRVALIGENSVEYVNTLIDIWNNGDCAVLLDWRIPIETAYEMMQEAGVQKCYIENTFVEKYELSNYPIIQFIPFENRTQTATQVTEDIYEKFQINYSQNEAVVIYSSGTTGKSKGIVLSHFSINTNADAIIDYMKLGKNDCLYVAKSLSHSSTITGELLVSLKSGARLILAPTVVPPRVLMNNLSKFGVSTLCLNPVLLRMCAEECQKRSYSLPALKTIYVSGSVLDDQVYRIAHTAFIDVAIYNVYGLSEAGPRVTAQRLDCCKSNSVGKPIKGVKIAIVDNKGDIVPERVRGIVYVFTPSIYSGYISGKEKHLSLYKGWLNTGDIGYIDENGELHIVGRADDLIIINAHKIYPNDVEYAILNNTDVTECVVVGYVSSHTGAMTLGCVYVSQVSLSVNDKKQLGKILLPYEVPKYYLRVEELPKNQNGKILRNEVKKLLR